jgi:hypothetical protein
VIIEAAPVTQDGEPIITRSGEYGFFAGLRSDPFFIPNGRKLTDDVINMSIAALTQGAVPHDGLRPHADLAMTSRTWGRRTSAPRSSAARGVAKFRHGDVAALRGLPRRERDDVSALRA